MLKFAFDLQRFATQAQQSVHTGNTVLLKVRNQVVGRAQSLDGRRSFGTEGVYEIGSIMPQEHINNRYEGTVALERFLIKKADLAAVGMAALGEEILATPTIDIEVIDKSTGRTVRVYRGCTAVDYTENFRVGAIAGENATFQYLSSDRGTTEAASMYGISGLYSDSLVNSEYLSLVNASTGSSSSATVASGYLGISKDWEFNTGSSVENTGIEGNERLILRIPNLK